MADERALTLCRELARRVRDARLPVDGLILFGSAARGDMHEWSDIDAIALVSDAVRQDEIRDVRRAVYLIATELDSRFEIVAIPSLRFEQDESTPLLEVVRAEGVRIAA